MDWAQGGVLGKPPSSARSRANLYIYRANLPLHITAQVPLIPVQPGSPKLRIRSLTGLLCQGRIYSGHSSATPCRSPKDQAGRRPLQGPPLIDRKQKEPVRGREPRSREEPLPSLLVLLERVRSRATNTTQQLPTAASCFEAALKRSGCKGDRLPDDGEDFAENRRSRDGAEGAGITRVRTVVGQDEDSPAATLVRTMERDPTCPYRGSYQPFSSKRFPFR